jgi:hypothetical protein
MLDLSPQDPDHYVNLEFRCAWCHVHEHILKDYLKSFFLKVWKKKEGSDLTLDTRGILSRKVVSTYAKDF